MIEEMTDGMKMSNKEMVKIMVIYSIVFCLISFIIYMSMGSASFIFGEDGVHQYYPVYIYIGRYIRNVLASFLNGQFQIPQFDLSIGLGEDILTSLNYYGFGNILYLSSCFFSSENTELGYTILIFLHIYLAGLAYIYYVRNKVFSVSAILGTVFIYLFSIYTLTYGFWYPVYLMPLITLPVICRGIDISINNKRFSISLILAVMLQALSGFYHTYMVLLFAAVYGLLCICRKYKSIRSIFSHILQLFMQVIMGLGLSSIVLLPAIRGFLHSPRFEHIKVWDTIKNMIHMELDALPKMFGNFLLPNSYDRDCIELALPYFAVLCIMVSWRYIQDKSLKILATVVFGMYFLSPLSSFFMEGFPQNIYYNRWLFCFAFVFSLLSAVALDEIKRVSLKNIVIYVVLSGIYVILAVKLDLVGRGSFIKNYFFFGVFIALGLFLFFFTYCTKKQYMGVVIAIFNIILVTYTCYYEISVLHGNHRFTSKGSAWETINTSSTQEYMSGDEFFRFDIMAQNQNQPTAQGGYGVAEYYSIIPQYKANFFNVFGINEYYPWFITGLKGVDALEDLLCVKFYDYNDKLVRNEDYLPLGTTYHQYILEDMAEQLSLEERRNVVRDILILNRNPHICLQATERATMFDVSIGTNMVEGYIELDAESMLFLAIPYLDGWTAFIDDIETEIFIADYSFIGLEVPAGKHRIILKYRTPGLLLGEVCSLIFLSLFILLLLRRIYLSNKQKD